MTHLDVVPLVDEGPGNSAYLLDLGDGRALAVDASRDLRALRAATERRGLRFAYAADTHLHADFLSGARELAITDGAQVLASAAGNREFAHTALADGDEVDLGGLTLRALATPGHTHEHIAFEVLDGPTAIGVFTGGSLLVGAAARTDLVALERTEELARAQYRSLRRLATLDDAVGVWPTHGAGSSCSAPPGAQRTSTIGADIRQTSEFAAGHVPDARHIELGVLATGADAAPAGRTVVMCGHGERATTAASLLARAGRADLAVLAGGPSHWTTVTGATLEVGA